MALSTSKVVRLTFNTAGGKTFAITIDNPKEDLQLTEAMAAMNSLIASDIFLFFWGCRKRTGRNSSAM
ncbi:DUF2922 domain-containing protein [Desulfosporosinus shakirovi]|uniref:DUF2922 domain-containing protein n=1 Tax=Desulfosporosinus shakirovi TaxID=2885154 RepID=UPI001E4985BF|nr:DUF2922 domain-containing protein [Desulfosporosinus sp. SRJS8]MCB8816178.1 DUF2922 domain-containing protein [Desulfosporosinus sp. SRJS8]